VASRETSKTMSEALPPREAKTIDLTGCAFAVLPTDSRARGVTGGGAMAASPLPGDGKVLR
jgi:hypothetical protein